MTASVKKISIPDDLRDRRNLIKHIAELEEQLKTVREDTIEECIQTVLGAYEDIYQIITNLRQLKGVNRIER